MKLTGSIEIAAPARDVWDRMVDPRSLAGCIPGVEDLRQLDERTFEGAITASIGPLTGRFTFTAAIARAAFPDDLSVRVEGVDSVTGSRVMADVDAAVRAAAGPTGESALEYAAVLRVKGRLAILGEMVLRATATVMIAQVASCLRAQLETSEPSPTP